MNKDIKRKWLAALRRKSATQVVGTLKKVNVNGMVIGHCCLGILCEIHQETASNRFKWRDQKFRGIASYGTTVSYSEVALTPALLKWSGLDEDATKRLVNLNDIDKLSFRQIAKVISKEY